MRGPRCVRRSRDVLGAAHDVDRTVRRVADVTLPAVRVETVRWSRPRREAVCQEHHPGGMTESFTAISVTILNFPLTGRCESDSSACCGTLKSTRESNSATTLLASLRDAFNPTRLSGGLRCAATPGYCIASPPGCDRRLRRSGGNPGPAPGTHVGIRRVDFSQPNPAFPSRAFEKGQSHWNGIS